MLKEKTFSKIYYYLKQDKNLLKFLLSSF